MDIITAIDQATGCQHCGNDLGASPSDDFCGQDCQEAWAEARTEPLVGYREPYHFTPDDYEDMPRRWMAGFDGITGAPPVLHSVANGRIYVADVGTPFEADGDGGWRELGTLTSEVVFTSTTPDGTGPLRDLLEAQRRVEAEIRVRFEHVAHTLAPVMEQMFRAVSTALEPLGEALQALQPPTPPADPRERALWLRQHRNTGPTRQQRPPRTINARRHR